MEGGGSRKDPQGSGKEPWGNETYEFPGWASAPTSPENMGSKFPWDQWVGLFFSDEELARTGVIFPWIRALLLSWSSLPCPGNNIL